MDKGPGIALKKKQKRLSGVWIQKYEISNFTTHQGNTISNHSKIPPTRKKSSIGQEVEKRKHLLGMEISTATMENSMEKY